MREKHQPLSRLALSAIAVAIGIFFIIGERYIFAAALERSIDLSDTGPLVANLVLVSIPLFLLAMRSSARALPWLLAIALTGWVRWWFLWMGIEYQRAPDGSGVPMFEALLVLLSPLPISALALITDWFLRRQTKVR